MRKLIFLLLTTLAWSQVNIRLVTDASYHKLINGNSGIEFLVKTSINLNDSLVLKLGASETYTAARGSFSYNHNLIRTDIGVFWIIANDFQVGYVHSARNLIEGATYTDVFPHESVDILTVRKEFDLSF